MYGKALKNARKKLGKTQQQMAMKHNVSRETYSSYETERAKIPLDISRKIANDTDDFDYMSTIKFEYTAGAAVRKLDGPKVELHRSVVKEKTLEEIKEFLAEAEKVPTINRPDFATEDEKKKIEHMLIQAVDVVYAIEHLVAVFSKDYGLGYLNIWHKHHEKLLKRGYVSG